jgi:uncharacterized protein YjdB
MRASNLPSPGHLRLSQELRVISAQAISAAEMRGARGGTSPELLAFFTACAAAITAAAPLELTGIDVTPATSSKAVGSTTQLSTAAVPSGAILPIRTYASSDITKATVNSTGLVTFVAVGTATITVTAGGFTDTVAITVTA